MTFELPKLIWVWVDDPTYTHGGWTLDKESKNAPYVRGDLYNTLTKERDDLAAAVEKLQDLISHMQGEIDTRSALLNEGEQNE